MADQSGISVRKGQGSRKLTKEEFSRRWRQRFYDPAFDRMAGTLDELAEIAWASYDKYRKSPRTRKAGPGFADPEFELSVEWLETRERIQQAEREQKDESRRSRILLVCGADRKSVV